MEVGREAANLRYEHRSQSFPNRDKTLRSDEKPSTLEGHASYRAGCTSPPRSRLHPPVHKRKRALVSNAGKHLAVSQRAPSYSVAGLVHKRGIADPGRVP